MPYAATNAATEIVKKIGDSLDSAGYSNLKNAAAGSPPTGYDLKTAQAPVDGWLRPAVEAQATTFQLAAQTVVAGSGWTTLTASAWSVTAYCPRPMLLIASVSGYFTAPGNNVISYRVRYDGNVIATATVAVNSSAFHEALPILQGVIPAAQVPYPLAAKTIDIQINTAAIDWNTDANDPVSYSIS